MHRFVILIVHVYLYVPFGDCCAETCRPFNNPVPSQALRWGHDHPRHAEEGASLRAWQGREVGLGQDEIGEI